jgi:hypothetical protein
MNPNLTPTEKRLVDKLLTDSNLLWMPHPENVPQIQAYVSEADILYYGGAAGGGKSDLLLGLSVTAHKKSIIFRREYKQLRELIDRSTEILEDTKARYSQTASRWRNIPGRRTLEFGAIQHEKDKENYKGRPHDLKGFDEIPDFTESQFRFLIAWNRSTNLDQRCRVVCAGNPPTHAEGEWVIRYWAPWLSESYPRPAKPGELRWFAGIDGKDVEVESGARFDYKGESIRPLSRTFIPALLGDNPYLRDTTYEAVLQGLPEPLRSQLLHGLFTATRPDMPYQVIPTEWVKAAQARWRDREPPDLSLTRVGVDPSRGGADSTEIAPRRGSYYHPLLSYPGQNVPDGPACAALVIEALGEDDTVPINVDIIGIGASVYDIMFAQGYEVAPVNFAEKSTATDKTGRLEMRNIRAEAYWKMREALDPKTGDDIALPPGDELIADLVAPQWRMTTTGVLIEPKKDIRKRLGRSPGKGDAVVLANFESVRGVLFR